MSIRLEVTIENKVVRWAEEHEWLVFKLNLPGNNGWPDRLFIGSNGEIVFIEFKKPGEKLRKLQEQRARTLRARKVNVYDCNSAGQGIRILTQATLGPPRIPT